MKQGKHPGRVRERVAARLLACGIVCSPYDLWTQEGYYRIGGFDGARWGAYKARFVNGIAPDGTAYHGTVHLCSWDTMTECARYGFDTPFSKDRSMGWGLVDLSSARPTTTPRTG